MDSAERIAGHHVRLAKEVAAAKALLHERSADECHVCTW
jgi:hypothetical protein